MFTEGGWEFVRVIGEYSCVPVEFTEEGLEELGTGPVHLSGKIGRPLGVLEETVPETICLVQTLDGILAKVPLAVLEEFAPDAGENGGFDCAWPLTLADEDPDGWQFFGQTICEHVRWKGFCVVHLTMSPEERRHVRTPVANFSADVWRRLPSDVEEVYLGRNPMDKMCWMPADQNSLEPEDDLQKCDRALTELAALLSPLTDEYFNFVGYGRTGTMVRTPIKSDSELQSLKRFMKEIPVQELTQAGFGFSPKVESYVSFAQLRRLCIIQFTAGSGGVLRLHPKFGISWLEEVEIPCEENRLVVFRHDLMSYTYAPSNPDSVALQTWMLSQSHAAAASGLDEEGVSAMDYSSPEYGQSGRTVGVMSMHKNTPGNVWSCQNNWSMFFSGCDTTITVGSTNRWDHQAYYEPEVDKSVMKNYSNHGGFLVGDHMFVFDAEFFGLPEEEVCTMDPGHRRALEVGYQCLNKAGFNRKTVLGKEIGVFIGNSGSDFMYDQNQQSREMGEVTFATATSCHFLAARFSHILGIRGPTNVDDTACSSSLVAVNVGYWGLRPQEPGQLRASAGRQLRWALCQGVNALLGVATWVGLCGPKMLSPRGRCFSFDHSADGFNRAEAISALTLKHLEDYEEQSDRLAMVCGGCVNQDGRSASMTAPHGPSQQECIRNSLREANLTPADIRIAELHGTGTALGDPIEVGALRGVMRIRKQPIFNTTGKTNYGHLEAAAGISGFMKCVMMLTHGACMPNVHLRSLNANIDTNQYPVMFNDAAVSSGNSGFAGVSSFGFGGTNARGDVWARALTGPFSTGGDWYGMNRLDYIHGRKQDFIDRSNALEDPDFSESFKQKLQMGLRASYSRQEADSIGKDWRLSHHTWLGKPIVEPPEPLPIGPGTGKDKKASLEDIPEKLLPALEEQAVTTTSEQAMSSEPFTKQRALAMQLELISYYTDPEFQSNLRKVFEETQGEKKAFMAARSNLLFEKVQIHVLGKYGFEVSKKGVALSNVAFAPYSDDPEISKNNLRMMYLTMPDAQEISLEQFVEDSMKEQIDAVSAARAKQEEKRGQAEPFTMSRAIEMQEELIAAYRNAEFQKRIREVMDDAKDDSKAFMAARSALLFEMVQTHVLPKYGFENSRKGVMQSARDFTPFGSNPEVMKNNAVMQYLTTPTLQEVSLESYLEEALKPQT